MTIFMKIRGHLSMISLFIFLLIMTGCSLTSEETDTENQEDTFRSSTPRRDPSLGDDSVDDNEVEEIVDEFNQEKSDEESQDLKKKIEKILLDQSSKFQRCYHQVLNKKGKGPSHHSEKNRNMKGVMTLAFTLDPQGKILRAGVEESDLPLNLKACLVEALLKIKFPLLTGTREIEVRLPLNFILEE